MKIWNSLDIIIIIIVGIVVHLGESTTMTSTFINSPKQQQQQPQ